MRLIRQIESWLLRDRDYFKPAQMLFVFGVFAFALNFSAFGQCTSPPEDVSMDATGNTKCQAPFDGTLTIYNYYTHPTSFNYDVSIDGGATFISNPTGKFMKLTGLSSGGYTVFVKDRVTGCVYPATRGASIPFEGTRPAAPTLAVTQATTCNPTNGKITASPTTGSYSIDGGATWQTSNVFDNLAVGSYSVLYKNTTTGCISTPSTLGVINSITSTNTVVQPTSCNPANGKITVDAPAPGANIEYSIDNGASWVASNVFNNLPAGKYTILNRNTSTLCTGSTTATLNAIDFPWTPTWAATATNLTKCSTSAPDGKITFTDTAGNPWEQSIDGGLTWSTATTFSNLAAGNYTAMYRNPTSKCPSPKTYQLTITAPTVVSPTVVPTNLTTCTANDGQLAITAPTPLTDYLYSIDGTDPSLTTSTFTGLASGNYTVTIKNKISGCVSNRFVNLTCTKPTVTKVAYKNGGTTPATSFAVGDIVNYVISVQGGTPTGDVTLTDVMSTNQEYIASSAKGSGWTFTGGTAAWFGAPLNGTTTAKYPVATPTSTAGTGFISVFGTNSYKSLDLVSPPNPSGFNFSGGGDGFRAWYYKDANCNEYVYTKPHHSGLPMTCWDLNRNASCTTTNLSVVNASLDYMYTFSDASHVNVGNKIYQVDVSNGTNGTKYSYAQMNCYDISLNPVQVCPGYPKPISTGSISTFNFGTLTSNNIGNVNYYNAAKNTIYFAYANPSTNAVWNGVYLYEHNLTTGVTTEAKIIPYGSNKPAYHTFFLADNKVLVGNKCVDISAFPDVKDCNPNNPPGFYTDYEGGAYSPLTPTLSSTGAINGFCSRVPNCYDLNGIPVSAPPGFIPSKGAPTNWIYDGTKMITVDGYTNGKTDCYDFATNTSCGTQSVTAYVYGIEWKVPGKCFLTFGDNNVLTQWGLEPTGLVQNSKLCISDCPFELSHTLPPVVDKFCGPQTQAVAIYEVNVTDLPTIHSGSVLKILCNGTLFDSYPISSNTINFSQTVSVDPVACPTPVFTLVINGRSGSSPSTYTGMEVKYKNAGRTSEICYNATVTSCTDGALTNEASMAGAGMTSASGSSSVTATCASPPITANDTDTYTPGSPKTVNPLTNDTAGDPIDPTTLVFKPTIPGATLSADGKTLTVPGEGVWTLDPMTGEATFTPESGFTGSPTPPTYTGKNAAGVESNPSTITITPAPVTANDTDTYTPGSPKTLNPLANDTGGSTIDPTTLVFKPTIPGATLSADGKTLTVPGEGVWTLDPVTGAATFTPEAGFKGSPTPPTYTGKDAAGVESNPSTITITPAPVTANDTDTYTAGSPKTLNPLTNDTAGSTIDPTTLVFKPTIPGATLSADGKTLTVPGEGVWTIDPVTGAATFTPEAGFKGSPTPPTYTGKDAAGVESNPSTITITPAPVTANDTDTYTPGAPKTLNPLTNDTAGSTIDPTTLVFKPTIPGATLSADGKTLTVPGEGVWTLDPMTGEATFTPESGFTGSPTPPTYTGKDAAGVESNPSTITITPAPVTANDTDTYTAGSPKTLNPLTNDTAGSTIDPTTLVFKPTIPGATLSADGKTLTVPGEGVWTIDPVTGAATFTPEAGFKGSPTPPTYTGKDAAGVESNPSTITITPAPVTANDTDTYTPGSPKTLNPLTNDTAGSTIDPTTLVFKPTIPGATLSADGKTLTVPGEGVWTLDPVTGAATFTPEAGFKGSPTPPTYTGKDAAGVESNPSTITITPAPVTANDTDTYTPGSPKTLNPLTNDTAGSTIDPTTLVFKPTIPGATLSADGKTLTVPGEGVWTLDPVTGAATFTPEAGFKGSPTPPTYTGKDAAGVESNPSTITITPAPVTANDTDTYTAGSPKTLNPLTNDTAGSTIDPTTLVFKPTIPGATLSADGKTLTVPGEGVWTLDPVTGAATFTPEAGFKGSPTPPTYTGKDAAGVESNPSTITITPAPVTANDTDTYTPGAPKTLNPLTNDTAGSTIDPTTLVFKPTIPGATLSADGKTLTVPGEGVWTLDPVTGAATFTPEAGFKGSPTPPTYTGKDAAGVESNPSTITITPAPVTANDTDTYTPGAPKTLNPLTNDTAGSTIDPTTLVFKPTIPGATLSADGKTLTVPGEGVWTLDPVTGAATFTPESGFTGSPTPPTYTGKDAAGVESNPSTITITPAPVTANDTDTYTPGSPKTLNPLTNDTAGSTIDPTTLVFKPTIPGATLSADGKTLTVPGEGVWTLDPVTGAATFTPEAGFKGSPTPPTYTGKDAAGVESNPSTITITPAPVTANDTDTYTPGSPKTLNPLANDTGGSTIDPTTLVFKPTIPGATLSADGKTLTVPGEGVWTLDPVTGAAMFTPEAGFKGSPTPPTYTGKDAAGVESNPSTITITPAPITANDTDTYTAGSPKTLNPLTNDTAGSTIDPTTLVFKPTIPGATLSADGKTLTVPGEGVWTLDPVTGAATFTPEAGFKGSPTPPTYTGKDAAGVESNPSTITITPAPVTANDTDTYTPGSPKTLNPLANDTGGSTIDPTTLVFKPTIPGATLSADGKTLTVPGEGVWTLDPVTGAATFTPEAGFKGSPTPPTYTGKDAAGVESNPSTITITPAPVTANDTDTYTAGSPKTLNPLTNDTAGSTIDPTTLVFKPTIPGATLSADGKTLTVPGEGVWTLDPVTGAATFTPEAGFKGSPTPPTYTGKDAAGVESNPSTITITPCTLEIGGTVYVGPLDVKGVNGTPIDGIKALLYMTLWNGNTQIGVQQIAADGTYKFTGVAPGTYKIVLGGNSAGSSFAAISVLPTTFTTIKEGGNVINVVSLNRLTAQGDGTPDGKTTITVDCNTINYEHLRVAATASYLNNDFQINNVSTLPVDLINFGGKQIVEQINLTWKTANEKEFSHFEVQKSADAKEFGSLGNVTGNKSSIYNFVDTNPVEGLNYYRLKMVDLDGTSKLSKVISVNFEKGGSYVSVENPANNGEFKVFTNLKNPKFNLLSTLGKSLQMSSFENSTHNYTLKAHNTAGGIYYLNIISEDGKVITKKVIIP